MSQTRIAIEKFEGAGTLQAGTVGAFSDVPAGSMLKHRRGYWVSGTGASPGRSGVVKDADLEAYFNQSISGGNIYSIHVAICFRDFGAASVAGHFSTFLRALNNALAEVIWVGIRSDGSIAIQDPSAGYAALGTILTLNTWYYFAFTVQQNANTSTAWQLHYKPEGGTWTQLVNRPAAGFGITTIERLALVNKFVAGVYHWRGHVSVAGFYSVGSFADVAFPGDVNEPPQAQLASYAAAGGSSANDGSQSAPWPLDIVFLNNELAYGLFGSNNGYANGETLYINTSNGNDLNLRVAGVPQSLAVATRGINILPIAGETYWKVRGWETLGAVFVQDGTNANLWRYTTSGGNSGDGICVWENDVNPSKISRSAYGSEALALADMNTKPAGEFWWYPEVSGLSVVIKPSGNGNPNTNGKTYTASGNIGGAGAAAVIVTVFDVNIDSPHVIKTCLAKSSATANLDGDAVDGSCVHFDVGSGGNYRLATPFFDKWAKHAYKTTNSSSNSPLTEVNVPLGNGSNYCPAGGQSGVAYFNGNAAATGNTVDSASLSQTTNAMLPQSTGGTANLNHASVLIHNAGSGSQFTTITFTNANLCSVVSKQIGGVVVINSSRTGGINNVAGTMTVNSQTRINGAISGLGITVNPGCIIAPTENLNASNVNLQVSGAISAIGCTIDVSACVVGDATASLFYRTAAATLTFKGCVWKDGGKDIALGANFATGEVVSDYNDIGKPAANRWLETYNAADATGTQAIALGIDNHSVFSADPKISVDYKLASDSPGRGLVSLAVVPALAGTLDFNGRTRAATGNTDAGALLYINTASGLSRFRSAGARGVRVGRKF